MFFIPPPHQHILLVYATTVGCFTFYIGSYYKAQADLELDPLCVGPAEQSPLQDLGDSFQVSSIWVYINSVCYELGIYVSKRHCKFSSIMYW